MNTCPCHPKQRDYGWLTISKRDAFAIAVRFLQRPRWRRFTLGVALTLGLFMVCDLFVCESVLIPSTSMEPTILPGDHVLLAKLPYRTVRRFDVVVIDSGKLKERIAKRVIGLPGERIRIEGDGKVAINGHELRYQPGDIAGEFVEAGGHAIRTIANARAAIDARGGGPEITLGADEYFVLGDNRPASRDSRVIGPVRREEIEGRLELVWYSSDAQSRRTRWDRVFNPIR